MTDALARDLDTGAVLTMLHRGVHDPHHPSGSKFETLVGVDRVLAPDLTRQVEKLRRRVPPGRRHQEAPSPGGSAS